MFSAVTSRPIFSPVSAVGNTDGLKPAQQPGLLAKAQNGGGPSRGQITSTPQFVQLMSKNPALRQVSRTTYENFSKSTGKTPQPAHPGAAYFQVLNGLGAGSVVDISKEKYLGKFMSSSAKIDLMEYGFGQLGLKKIGNVTIDQFAKANTYYREVTASGSNSGAVQRALKDFGALGDKAFPNGPEKNVKAEYPTHPKTVEELHPWLQGEVGSRRMKLEKAIEITEATARRAAMRGEGPPPPPPQEYSRGGGETCITRASVIDRRELLSPSGKYQISTRAYAYTDGQSARTGENQTRSTTRITILHPQTRLPVVVRNGGYGVHAESQVQDLRGRGTPLLNPQVIAEGRCYFNDGRVVPSTQGPLMNTDRPNPDPTLPPGSVRRR